MPAVADIRLKNPAQPGGFGKHEVIAPLGLSVTAAANVLGVTRATLSCLLNERANLSPEMALRIEKAFGVSLDTLVRMRSSYAIDDGIRIIGSLPEVERLRILLTESPIDPHAICSKAGVILESLLDCLTQKYECAARCRHGAAYTLGDLLPAINGKLRDALKVEIRDGLTDATAAATNAVDLKPLLDELARIAQARNAFDAHFKAISFELLDTDAVGFAEHVMLLVDALTHPEHGWPSNDKSGSYWRNGGDSRRLHRLKRPG